MRTELRHGPLVRFRSKRYKHESVADKYASCIVWNSRTVLHFTELRLALRVVPEAQGNWGMLRPHAAPGLPCAPLLVA